jgi:hypothetical protein
MNKHIIVGALAGLFSLGAFAQASTPVSNPADAQASVAPEAASAVTHKHAHKHKHHKHHHASTVAEASAPAADAPITKP